jgi:hypothetical protein
VCQVGRESRVVRPCHALVFADIRSDASTSLAKAQIRPWLENKSSLAFATRRHSAAPAMNCGHGPPRPTAGRSGRRGYGRPLGTAGKGGDSKMQPHIITILITAIFSMFAGRAW